MSIHIGPRVLGLAVLQQDGGHHVVQLGHQLEERIIGKVLQGELALAGVARIGLAQDSVTVPGDHLTRVQRVPDSLLQLLIADLCSAKRYHGAHTHTQNPNQKIRRGLTLEFHAQTLSIPTPTLREGEGDGEKE